MALIWRASSSIVHGTDLANSSFMNLSFDQGTLLLKELSVIRTDPGQCQSVFTQLPGVLWDERVNAFRAPGFRYHDILKAIRASNTIVIDSVTYKWNPEGKWIAPELRPYQREALCAWDLADRHGIAVFPTGGGKTRLAMAAMAKTGFSTLCLVPTRILIEQWQKEIKKFYSGKIGVYGDGQKELAPITISTFESAYRNMNQIGNRFELLIVDEVHHFGNGIRDELLEMSTAKARLGLTATMSREEPNIAKISSLVGRPICELTIGDLSGKYLADFDLFSLQLNLNLTERIAYDADMKLFREFHSTFYVSFPNAEWSVFARFAARSEQGREAMRALARAKRLTAFIQAKAEALESILKRHRKRGGSQGEREHIQRIGRLLRPVEGKRAVVYELICRNTIEVRQWKKRNVGLGAGITA